MKNTAITISLLFALCSTQIATLADHITVQGEVSGVWNADTVLVAGDLSVPDGENLLIQPGTVVQFQGSFAFYVEGSVNASGSGYDSIFFQIADTTGFAVDSIPDGGWGGIRFDHNRATNEMSTFYRCRFSFGKNVSENTMTGNGGAMSIRAFDKVLIDECHFSDNFAVYNGGAVALDSSDITIRHSVFSRNRCGKTVSPWGYGGGVSSDNSSPEIRWNTFSGNSSTGVGGGLCVRYQDCNVYNNIFTGNVSGLGGGLCILHIPVINYRVNNNLLVGNTAVYFGGGVATMDSDPIYINNTIVYNTASYGGGFYCKDSISPDFYNTIFWGNTAAVGPQGYLFEVYSQADFFYCDVEGGPELFGGSGGGEAFFGAYEQCLDEDPEFFDYSGFPYQLNPQSSPCIDAGTTDTNGFFLPEYDLANLPRIWGGSIEMGAYESVYEGLPEQTGEDAIQIWPNPTNGKFQITNTKFQTNSETINEIKKIEILDIHGKVLLSLGKQGYYNQIVIDISHLPPGIYLVKIPTEYNSTFHKLLKVSR